MWCVVANSNKSRVVNSRLSFRHIRNPAFLLPLVVSDTPLDIDLPHSLHGIFYRAAEHPRIRTAQACNKCRVRKAKGRCSGERPICERCRIRGLVCQYPIEERTRRGGPPSRIAHA
ncbi:hypothetical protein EV363DRAFT_1326393, partial [Boletus edulis]